MKEPLFLRLNEIIEIHSDQIARYGGSTGMRLVPIAFRPLGASLVNAG
jgi:hypothetical protein